MSFVDWFMASFLYCFPYSYRSSNYSTAIVVALLRERATTIAIAIVERAITLERKTSKKKQRTDTKKDAKRIKSDNFTRSNREMNDWTAP